MKSANQPEPSFENDFGKWIESNGVVLNPYLNDDGSFRADKIDLNQLKVGIVALFQADKEAAVRDAQLNVLNKVGAAYHKHSDQDAAREALSMALWKEIRDLEASEGEGK